MDTYKIKQTRLVQVLCFLGAQPLVLNINRYQNLLGDASLHPPQTPFQKTCPSVIRLAVPKTVASLTEPLAANLAVTNKVPPGWPSHNRSINFSCCRGCQ